MAKDEMKIGEVSKPRFEFRTFGQDFAVELLQAVPQAEDRPLDRPMAAPVHPSELRHLLR